jgi:hypothetical protein
MTNESSAPSSNPPPESQQKWSDLVKRARTDERLKQQLLEDPTPVLLREGIDIPEGAQVRVVEARPHLYCIFETPRAAAAAAGAELTADDLSSVTGGGDVVARKAGKGQQEFLVIKMSEVLLT